MIMRRAAVAFWQLLTFPTSFSDRGNARGPVLSAIRLIKGKIMQIMATIMVANYGYKTVYRFPALFMLSTGYCSKCRNDSSFLCWADLGSVFWHWVIECSMKMQKRFQFSVLDWLHLKFSVYVKQVCHCWPEWPGVERAGQERAQANMPTCKPTCRQVGPKLKSHNLAVQYAVKSTQSLSQIILRCISAN